MQIPLDLIKLIRSQRSFRVKVDGERSSWRPMLAGVPQGSTLSPLLYNLYTADIPQSHNTNLAMYADDICIYAKTRNIRFANLAVQRHLSEVEGWTKKWRILINPDKTNCIVFSKKRKPKLPKLEMYGRETGITKRALYLGVMMQYRLNWRPHCDLIRGKAHLALRELTPLLRSALPLKTKLLVYSAYIRPILTYAAEAWAYILKQNMSRLQVVQNRALRIIRDYDYDVTIQQLHEDCDIPTLKQYIRQQARKFYNKTATNTNTLITQLGQYDPHNTQITPKAIIL